MSRLRYDNSVGTLGASLTNSGTTITFASAPSFATLSGSDYIPLILEPATTSPSANYEVVHLTAYTSGATTGTISRGQDGTTGVAHANGVAWACGPVVQDLSPQEWQNTVTTSGAAQTIPDPGSSPFQTENIITLTANCTLTFPTAGAGKSFLLSLTQDATGSRTVTWPGTVKWSGGTTPVLTTTATKTDVFSFTCLDGTNWIGVAIGFNF